MKPEVPISIAMPAIPPRCLDGDSHRYAYPVEGIVHVPGAGLYEQAVTSVANQTVMALGLHVALDTDHEGAAATRQRALDMALADPRTKFVSFIDDDDLWYPWHLETHWNMLQESGADVAYSWFDGNNPFPRHRGRQWDPNQPHHITMCITVRASLASQVAFQPDPNASSACAGEDWMFLMGLNDLGARFVGTDKVTFHYRLHDHNTSGLGNRW